MIEYKGIENLYLPSVEVFSDREDFGNRTGQPAPPFNPRRPIQMWRDTRIFQSGQMVNYFAVNPHAQSEEDLLVAYQIPAAEAGLPNLPGHEPYPSVVHLPTQAEVAVDPVGERWDRIDPARLMHLAEAKAIAAEIGAGDPVQFAVGLQIRWNGETRRFWGAQYKDRFLDLALLRNQKQQFGVGAPGHWDLSGSEPVWIAERPSDPGPNHPVRYVPCRLLQAGERWFKPLVGPWLVESGTPDPDHGSGELLDRLARLEVMLNKILDLLRKP